MSIIEQLFASIQKMDVAKVKELLIQHPSLVHEKHPGLSQFPLYEAAATGNRDLFHMLLEHGADLFADVDQLMSLYQQPELLQKIDIETRLTHLDQTRRDVALYYAIKSNVPFCQALALPYVTPNENDNEAVEQAKRLAIFAYLDDVEAPTRWLFRYSPYVRKEKNAASLLPDARALPVRKSLDILLPFLLMGRLEHAAQWIEKAVLLQDPHHKQAVLTAALEQMIAQDLPGLFHWLLQHYGSHMHIPDFMKNHQEMPASYHVSCEINWAAQEGSPAAPLVQAAKEGDLEKVKLLLLYGVRDNLSSLGSYEGSALYHAIQQGHLPIVQVLYPLEREVANPVALETAAKYGQDAISTWLLAHGCKAGNAIGRALWSKQWRTAQHLIMAIQHFHLSDDTFVPTYAYALIAARESDAPYSILDLLVQKGADLEYVLPLLGSTELHRAAGSLDIAFLRWSFGYPVKAINTPDKYGNTVLHRAIESCDLYEKPDAIQENTAKLLEVLHLLLDKGADINAKNTRDQKTPMELLLNCISALNRENHQNAYTAAIANLCDVGGFLLRKGAIASPSSLQTFKVGTEFHPANDASGKIVLLASDVAKNSLKNRLKRQMQEYPLKQVDFNGAENVASATKIFCDASFVMHGFKRKLADTYQRHPSLRPQLDMMTLLGKELAYTKEKHHGLQAFIGTKEQLKQIRPDCEGVYTRRNSIFINGSRDNEEVIATFVHEGKHRVETFLGGYQHQTSRSIEALIDAALQSIASFPYPAMRTIMNSFIEHIKSYEARQWKDEFEVRIAQLIVYFDESVVAKGVGAEAMQYFRETVEQETLAVRDQHALLIAQQLVAPCIAQQCWWKNVSDAEFKTISLLSAQLLITLEKHGLSVCLYDPQESNPSKGKEYRDRLCLFLQYYGVAIVAEKALEKGETPLTNAAMEKAVKAYAEYMRAESVTNCNNGPFARRIIQQGTRQNTASLHM